jgi:hypothetical protein
MQLEEIDFLFEGQVPQSFTDPSFDSSNLSSQDAPLGSSSSTDDSDLQFTPSSTAYDLQTSESNLEDISLDLSDYASSPIGYFEQTLHYGSRSSEYSSTGQSFSHSMNSNSSSGHHSREATGGPMSDQAYQPLSSFDAQVIDIDNHVEAPLYHGFTNVTAAPAGAPSTNSTYGMTLPLRISQQPQAWEATSLHSCTYTQPWIDAHQRSAFLQNEPLTQLALQHADTPHYDDQHQSQINITQSFCAIPLPSGRTLAPGGLPLPLLQPVHNLPRQCGVGQQVFDETRCQSSKPRGTLSHSTRRRFPDHPAIAAEQKSPLSPIQKQRQLAVAHPEEIPVTARLRVIQDDKPKQGGRKKNTHLSQEARDRSSKMRKKGACWRCKLQRDPVSCPTLQFKTTY